MGEIYKTNGQWNGKKISYHENQNKYFKFIQCISMMTRVECHWQVEKNERKIRSLRLNNIQVSDDYDKSPLSMSESQLWVAEEIRGDEEHILNGDVRYKESPSAQEKLPFSCVYGKKLVTGRNKNTSPRQVLLYKKRPEDTHL